MSTKDFNLPQSKAYEAEIVKLNPENKLQLTEKQIDQVFKAGVQISQDVGQIAKDIVAIAKIREEADGDVKRIEAETRGIESKIRAEIEHLAQSGENTRTRGAVAVNIISELTSIIRDLPDLDSQSRHRLIDAICPVITAAISAEK